MPEVNATEASRNFSQLLDAVEHDGATYVIVGDGTPVAQLSPVARCSGAEVKALLAEHQPDADWHDDLAAVRALLEDHPRWSCG